MRKSTSCQIWILWLSQEQNQNILNLSHLYGPAFASPAFPLLTLHKVRILLVWLPQIQIFPTHPFLRCQLYETKPSESKPRQKQLSEGKKTPSLCIF